MRGVAKYREGKLTSVSVVDGIERAIAGEYGARFTMEDREGDLWIGGIGMGLHRFRPAQVAAYTAEQGLADSAFVPIAAARDGGLWLGGENGSIYHYRAGEFSPLSFSIDPAFRIGLRALYEDRTGALWAGGYFGLLRIRDGRAVGWNQLNSALSGYPVAAIFEDRADALWIGSGREGDEGGLYRFQNDTFIPYRKAEGLVFNDVRCIVEDRDGAIWAGGVGGMSRFKDGQLRTLARILRCQGGAGLARAPGCLSTCVSFADCGY